MKFIHIADVHLGMMPDKACPWGEQRRQDLWNSFRGVIDLCNREQIDLLLIAGDLFHRPPRVGDLKEVNYSFGELIKTKVVLIAGNHDYIGKTSHYRDFEWNKNVIMLDSERLASVELEECGAKVYGFSYYTRDIYEPRYQNIRPGTEEGYHILLAHGGDSRDIPIDYKALDGAGFDYVALGHIHKPGRCGQRMAYAGSLEPLDKNETGEHGYIQGEFDQYGELRLHFVPFSRCQYFHETFETDADTSNGELLKAVRERIEALGRENIYKLVLQGTRNPEIEFLTESLKALGRIVEIQDNTIPDYDYETLWSENRNNLIGIFIEGIRRSGKSDEIADKALYYGIDALIKAKE